MTGFLKIQNSKGFPTTINLEQVRYFYQDDKKVRFILASSGSSPVILYKGFDTQEQAKDYYNRLTEYLQILV